MGKTIQLCFVLLSLLLNETASVEIHLTHSTKKSKDISSCGAFESPCKTLKYATRKAGNGDIITINCGEEEKCDLKLHDNIWVMSKAVTIRGSYDNQIVPTLIFERDDLFQFTGLNAKLTISNLTIHQRWSFGKVHDYETHIKLEHCTIVMEKRKYSPGVGEDLIFAQVRRSAKLKLQIKKSQFIHSKFDGYQALNFILADGYGLSVDISIQQTKFDGNMMVILKSYGKGQTRLDHIHLNHTSVSIEGYSLDRSWESVQVTNSEFHHGLFQQQLKLENLQKAALENVSVTNKAGTGLRAKNIKTLTMKNCLMTARTNNIFNSGNVSLKGSRLQSTSLIIQLAKDVSLREMISDNSIMITSLIQNLVETEGYYNDSRLEISRVNSFNVTQSRHSTKKSSKVLIKTTESFGNLLQCEIEGGKLETHHSHLGIFRSKFVNSLATDGGAVYNENSSITFNYTEFKNCSAKYHGGCLYSTGARKIRLHNVNFTSYTSERSNPSSFGTVIHSTSPVTFENVLISMEDSTSSPLVFIKPVQEISQCKDVSSLQNCLKVICPRGRIVEEDIEENDMSEICEVKSLRFLSVSCVKCRDGYSNPFNAVLKYKKENDTFLKMNNTCLSCIQPQILGSQEIHSHELLSTCPKFIPLTTMECKSEHVIQDPPKCPTGYSLNLLSDQCIRSSERNRYSVGYVFWGVIILVSILYTIILMYIKEIVVILNFKMIYLWLANVLGHCYRRYFPDPPNKVFERFKSLEHDDEMVTEFNMLLVQHYHIQSTPLRFTVGTTLGVIKIIFFFYQVETLIRTTNPYRTEMENFVMSIIRDSLSTLFSLRISYDVDGLHMAPIENLTSGWKEFIKATSCLWLLVPVLLMAFTFLLQYDCRWEKDEKRDETNRESNNERNNNMYEDIRQSLMKKQTENVPPLKVPPMKDRFERIDAKVPIYVQLPIKFRMTCFTFSFMTLAYLPISTFLLKAVSCSVNADGDNMWSIQDDIECFNTWQYICFVIIAVWVVPLPAALYCASRMQYRCKINPKEFFFSLLFPPSLLLFYIRDSLREERRAISKADAMLAKHLLMTLYEPFRLQRVDKRFDVMWEVVYLTRKLILMALAIFAPKPYHLVFTFMFLVLCMIHHSKVKPFNRAFTHRLEMTSLTILCLLTAINFFWSHQNPCTSFHFMKQIRIAIVYAEYICLLWPLILVVTSLLLAAMIACFLKVTNNPNGREQQEKQSEEEHHWRYASRRDYYAKEPNFGDSTA